ncbi:uncharacterized protein ARMOST_21824 [Armillaria ostoyae]|uniref:Uncharacterized protein n=1 Tax=Armillaria ostoyae TaxID=47428 RepID=A0A284SB80_ARMOS|nr:uncharacterized protein ARMOST_21824 [Armillaria ostoyae]
MSLAAICERQAQGLHCLCRNKRRNTFGNPAFTVRRPEAEDVYGIVDISCLVEIYVWAVSRHSWVNFHSPSLKDRDLEARYDPDTGRRGAVKLEGIDVAIESQISFEEWPNGG